jgi:hypothetical protein
MANQKSARGVGIFEDQQHAINGVHALTHAGFSPQQIVWGPAIGRGTNCPARWWKHNMRPMKVQ